MNFYNNSTIFHFSLSWECCHPPPANSHKPGQSLGGRQRHYLLSLSTDISQNFLHPQLALQIQQRRILWQHLHGSWNHSSCHLRQLFCHVFHQKISRIQNWVLCVILVFYLFIFLGKYISEFSKSINLLLQNSTTGVHPKNVLTVKIEQIFPITNK